MSSFVTNANLFFILARADLQSVRKNI